MTPLRPRKVISGGQSGVDRAALRAAAAAGLEIGGWCPPGRASEDGAVPERYPLVETPSERSPDAPDVPRSQRTEWNVRDSDATLVLRPAALAGADDPGTAWALRCAERLGRPLLVVDPWDAAAAAAIRRWLDVHAVATLGVGGPSEASAPGIGDRTERLLGEVFGGAAGTVVVAVCRSARHTFSKEPQPAVLLVAGLGVEGDAHQGAQVKHRSRVRRDPSQPNLRQVHLIHGELHDELRAAGFTVAPGDLGENVTTRGVDLLALPAGTRLRLGAEAEVEITGLRNPCSQLDRFQQGLTAAVLDRGDQGELVRKAGVMAVVLAGGEVRPGDAIEVELPEGERRALAVV